MFPSVGSSPNTINRSLNVSFNVSSPFVYSVGVFGFWHTPKAGRY